MINRWKMLLFFPYIATYAGLMIMIATHPNIDTIFGFFILGANVSVSAWTFARWVEEPPKFLDRPDGQRDVAGMGALSHLARWLFGGKR